MSLSRELARFVTETHYADIPASVLETQKKSILDAVAITLGAATLGDGCQSFVTLAEENAAGGAGDATVIGFDRKLPMTWAAFANGSMAHSLDFGDTQMHAVIHSNASTFPAALALAERLGASGEELLAALVIGSEVACRISLGANEDLEKYGWYMPPIYTSFGATAACCKLLKLSADQVLDAFSFNLCQTTCSAELIQNQTTVLRSVREAFAARNALVSALAAQKGLKGFDLPFEGKSGFYAAYARGNYDEQRALDGLGQHFEAGQLSFKLWPSCAGTHPAIIGARQLANDHSIQPDDIERIHVVVSQRNRMLCEPATVRMAPTSSIIGKFSIPYTASVALIKGNVTLEDFTPVALADRQVLALAAKFTYEVNEAWGKAEGMNTEMVIRTPRGEFSFAYFEDGSAATPQTSFEDLGEKLRSCAVYAARPFAEERLAAIESAVRQVDLLPDIRQLTKLL
jgi:2-methylcitrate dehydratase PrpD